MIHWDAIPEALTRRAQWCVHRDKAPLQVTGRSAKSNEPATWTDYRTVRAACERDPTLGPEYMLSPDDGVVVLDLDHVRNPRVIGLAGIEPWAWDLVLMAETYAETSVSGTGIHIVGEAQLPQSRSKGPLQVFTRVHAITFTGNHFSDRPGRVLPIQPVVDLLVDFHLTREPVTTPPPTWRPSLATEDLRRRALMAANGRKLHRLLSGDITGYHSRSEADFAIVETLAFWTGDKQQIDAVIRSSPRFTARGPDWDEAGHTSDGKTYGELTIERGLELNTTTYTGGEEPPVPWTRPVWERWRE